MVEKQVCLIYYHDARLSLFFFRTFSEYQFNNEFVYFVQKTPTKKRVKSIKIEQVSLFCALFDPHSPFFGHNLKIPFNFFCLTCEHIDFRRTNENNTTALQLSAVAERKKTLFKCFHIAIFTTENSGLAINSNNYFGTFLAHIFSP